MLSRQDDYATAQIDIRGEHGRQNPSCFYMTESRFQQQPRQLFLQKPFKISPIVNIMRYINSFTSPNLTSVLLLPKIQIDGMVESFGRDPIEFLTRIWLFCLSQSQFSIVKLRSSITHLPRFFSMSSNLLKKLFRCCLTAWKRYLEEAAHVPR
jgi:hypothetical protein